MNITLKTALLSATLMAGLAAGAQAAPLVTAPVDDRVTAAVTGERSAMLARATDLGALPDTEILSGVRLVLKRPAERQAVFDRLVREQLDVRSRNYHRWLTPADLRHFGPDEADIAKTVAWLNRNGLVVKRVAPSGMSIEFSGAPRAIEAAFHTALHKVSLAGETHIANMTDLAIPAALAPVVRGATLANFFPKPNMVRPGPKFTIPNNPTFYAVLPNDFATIYNVKPLRNAATNLFGAPITGAGVSIVVIEQTDINPADWQSFRTQSGLAKFTGTLSVTHPGGCADPGFTGDEGEAALDAEWASAVAPGATIIEAACAGSAVQFGVENTLQNLVELGTTAKVASISYGGSEAGNGLTFLAGWNDLVEMAASEGISVMISTGDGGVSANTGRITGNGIAVNGLSTNAYNTSIGGTDFYDAALGKTAGYWSSINGAGLASAKSYIPEIPWDNGCSSPIIVKYLGYADPVASCNSTKVNTGLPFVQNDVGGTGGQSILISKPDWQSIGVPGVPADGVRDQPDVSLFASNGSWSHFYVFCMSNPATGGTPCDYTVVNDVFGNAAGGTSFAAPAFAGVVALVVEAKGFAIGNPAPRLYQLAKLQFDNPLLNSRCNSSLGKGISSACVFNEVTAGDNSEACLSGTVDCYSTKESTHGIGVLRSPSFPTVDAYPAGPGYNLATGLGTVNVTNLLYNF